MRRYTIELNAKQAQVISTALDLYSRIKSGQFDALKHELLPRIFDKEIDHEVIANLFSALKRVFFPELAENEWYGIAQRDKIGVDVQTAYDLHQVIRNRLAWDKYEDQPDQPGALYSVSFQEPRKVGTFVLPKMKGKKCRK